MICQEKTTVVDLSDDKHNAEHVLTTWFEHMVPWLESISRQVSKWLILGNDASIVDDIIQPFRQNVTKVILYRPLIYVHRIYTTTC